MADPSAIEEIVAAIAALSAAEQRQLLRRLRVSGLLPPAESAADRDRLALAPAVRKAAAPPSQPRTPPLPEPRAAGVVVPLRMASPATASGSRTPAGKVVLGAPVPVAAPEPHGMAPLPGQAPERPIVIIFDGGSKGNPGLGYGSYALRWPGQQQQVVQLTFGQGVTNNEAEYDTLLAALEAVQTKLRDARADPSTARLDIRGDSLLVINQVLNEWKCTDERMRKRRDQVRALLRDFGAWQLTHHDRENSVRVLGH
jgi:ribonuclease HI